MAMQLPAGAERLFDRSAVQAAYDRMADAINRSYDDEELVLLVVMTGGLVAAANLAERLELPVVIDYLHVSRYRSETRGGALEWITRPRQALAGRHVLVVDDILDEGATLAAISRHCREEGAASVRSAVLVQKAHDRIVDGVSADFVGLTVPDKFVFGCGMDLKDGFRHLPEIWAVPG